MVEELFPDFLRVGNKAVAILDNVSRFQSKGVKRLQVSLHLCGYTAEFAWMLVEVA